MISNKTLIILHIGFWLINFIYDSFFWGDPYDLTQLPMAIPFYINYFLLMPALFLKNKPVYYVFWFLSVFSMMVLTYLAYFVVEAGFKLEEMPYSIPKLLGIGAYDSFYYISVSTGSCLIVHWMKNKRLHHELMMKKTNTQIQLMKSNVNIPFILQTLNSIENQANISPEYAQQPVISLSNVLRYGLYDSQVNHVALAREIDILKDYFLLVNQNYSRFGLHLIVSGDVEKVSVPPNLVVKFVGAWKDSFHDKLEGRQEIELKAEDGNKVSVLMPGERESGVFSKIIQTRFIDPQQEGFDINYIEEDAKLQLVIKNFLNQL